MCELPRARMGASCSALTFIPEYFGTLPISEIRKKLFSRWKMDVFKMLSASSPSLCSALFLDCITIRSGAITFIILKISLFCFTDVRQENVTIYFSISIENNYRLTVNRQCYQSKTVNLLLDFENPNNFPKFFNLSAARFFKFSEHFSLGFLSLGSCQYASSSLGMSFGFMAIMDLRYEPYMFEVQGPSEIIY